MHKEKYSIGLKTIITQLDAKLIKINETRQTINKMKSLEDLYAFRLSISQSLFELDQEIRETIQSIRDFQLQIKELLSEKEFRDQKYKNLQEKYLNFFQYNDELKKNNKELIFQINKQQVEIVKSEQLVASMTEKLMLKEEACCSPIENNVSENSSKNQMLLLGKTNNSTSDSLNIKNDKNISGNVFNCSTDYAIKNENEKNEKKLLYSYDKVR